MMDQPPVSIMIPTYNQAHWLSGAIESALAQNYSNLEIIISDDRSTDETPQLLQKYKNHNQIKIFTNAKNLGRVANYKHTLENYVSGEWVVNLDGDDYYTDNSFISSAMDQIVKVPNVMFIQAGHSITGPGGKILYNAIPAIESEFEIIDGTEYFLNFNHFSHLGTIFNRQAAIGVGFYLHDILSADIECFLRLALHGKVILMRQSVGAWVHHESNESKKLSVDVVEKNMLRFKCPYAYAKETGKIPEKVLNKWMSRRLDEYLLNYLTVYFARRKKIPGYLAHALKKYPHLTTSIIIPKALLKGYWYKIKKLFRSKKEDE